MIRCDIPKFGGKSVKKPKNVASTESVKVSHSLCPTIYDPMGFSPPGSSIHGIFQAKILEWVTTSQEIFLTQGSNLGLLHCRQILYHLSHEGSQFWGSCVKKPKNVTSITIYQKNSVLSLVQGRKNSFLTMKFCVLTTN